MIPAMPTKARSFTSDIGSSCITEASVSSTKRVANESTRRPFSPIRSFASSRLARASAIGTWDPLSGPPASVQRASTTSGPPLTSSITRSTPSIGTRWNVAMNL